MAIDIHCIVNPEIWQRFCGEESYYGEFSYRNAFHTFTFTDVFLVFFFMIYEGQNLPKGAALYDETAEYETKSSVHYKVYLAAFLSQVCLYTSTIVITAIPLLVCIY